MKNEKKNPCLKVLTGRAGCGKTQQMLAEIASQPRRYVLAVIRKDLLEEHVTRVTALSKSFSTNPVLTSIHSDQSIRGAIGRRIADTLEAAAADVHAVVSITHQALFQLDPELLAGWHIRIDELPDGGIVSGNVQLGATWQALAARYTLKSSELPGWSIARPREDISVLQLSEITSDVAKDLVGLHRALTMPTRRVYINIGDWQDASLRRRSVKWWSIWSPAELAGCSSLSITAANYEGSLVDHAVRNAGNMDVKIRQVDASLPRTGNPEIRIHYYANHPGSTTWWLTEQGSYSLVQIFKHLESIKFDGFWTSNESIKSYFHHRTSGKWCLPKQAGSNNLRGHTACLMIYSAKAQIADEPVLDVLGLDRTTIQASREDEDIYQFAMRGAVRNHDFSGRYDIHLYDRSQAERLQHRMIAQGFADITLVPVVDAGIMDVTRPKLATGKRPAANDTASVSERREEKRLAEVKRGQRRRDALRAEQLAAGTLRRPGRPKRTASAGRGMIVKDEAGPSPASLLVPI